jgi:hypothetical protein
MELPLAVHLAVNLDLQTDLMWAYNSAMKKVGHLVRWRVVHLDFHLAAMMALLKDSMRAAQSDLMKAVQRENPSVHCLAESRVNMWAALWEFQMAAMLDCLSVLSMEIQLVEGLADCLVVTLVSKSVVTLVRSLVVHWGHLKVALLAKPRAVKMVVL